MRPSFQLSSMKRMIEVRKQHPLFGTGSFSVVNVDNPSVLAYVQERLQKNRKAVFVTAQLPQAIAPLPMAYLELQRRIVDDALRVDLERRMRGFLRGDRDPRAEPGTGDDTDCEAAADRPIDVSEHRVTHGRGDRLRGAGGCADLPALVRPRGRRDRRHRVRPRSARTL